MMTAFDFHARTEVEDDGAAFALFELGGDEPCGDPGSGRDRLPNLFRRAGDFGLDFDGTTSGCILLHGHDGSFLRALPGRG